MQRYLQQNVISTLYSQILMKLCLKLMQQKSFTQHFVTIYTIHQTIANHLLLIYYVSRIRTFDPQLNFNYVTTAAVR